MKNNKQLGEIGERVVIGELAKLKIDVLLPMTDNLPFDFAILFCFVFAYYLLKNAPKYTKIYHKNSHQRHIFTII